MKQFAEHFDFHPPNNHIGVPYLLDGIQRNNALLEYAMALVRNDTMPGGNINEFEATALCLLPNDPVSKKRSEGNTTGVAEISDTYGAEKSSTSTRKAATGKTGLEFCFYERSDYQKIAEYQKDKLHEYCKV